MLPLYSLALLVVLLVSSPVWGWRMLRQGRYRDGLRQRLGEVPERLRQFAQGRPVIWLHAVSVGEAMSATGLVSALEAALPGYAIVISTTTPTGQAVARERFGVDRVFFYPADFAFAVRSFLRALQPRLLVLVESELWPRMLVECARAGVPVAVVNARVSDRSLPRYLALRALWKPLLRRIALLLAQSREDAARWIRIGAPAERVQVSGNLKYDIRSAAETPLTTLVRRHLPEGARVLVCGSTHEGEEALLLDCWTTLRGVASPNGVMVLAPRHPERADAVEQLARERGLSVFRLSRWRLGAESIPPGAVLLVDTVGELAALYSLATVAFVGGSLVPHGGQNPLEPAQFGVPVLMGPSFENFREVVLEMQATGAIAPVERATLCAALASALARDVEDAERGRSRDVFLRASGATGRTVAALLPLLQERAG